MILVKNKIKSQALLLKKLQFLAEESAEGVRRMQNDSKKTSQEKDSADTLATISGWMEAIANLEEAPELKEKKAKI